MVYLTYPKADIYSLAVLTRARINSLGSPLEVCIPDGNIIFQNPSATLQHVFITKFKKLWLLTPKLSNRGWFWSLRTHEMGYASTWALGWWQASRIAATTPNTWIPNEGTFKTICEYWARDDDPSREAKNIHRKIGGSFVSQNGCTVLEKYVPAKFFNWKILLIGGLMFLTVQAIMILIDLMRESDWQLFLIDAVTSAKWTTGWVGPFWLPMFSSQMNLELPKSVSNNLC